MNTVGLPFEIDRSPSTVLFVLIHIPDETGQDRRAHETSLGLVSLPSRLIREDNRKVRVQVSSLVEPAFYLG